MSYQGFLLHTGTPVTEADAANFSYAVGDYNRDGIPDLFCLKWSSTGTNSLEVHALSGASNYQTFLLQTGTPISEADAAANFVFAVADYNRDGTPDLYCLKRTNTGTNSLELHVLSGASKYQSFLLHTGTPLGEADAAANFSYAVGDYNRNGIADVYCLKRSSTGTNSLEVHVLSGGNNYQSFLLHTGTPLVEADARANFDFAVGHLNRDGVPDVYCLKRRNTGTSSLEVHALDAGVVLNFNMQAQLQSQWCWSAVATSTSLYYDANSGWTQCTLVNAELGQTTCCANGATVACNQPWILDGALSRTGNLDRWQAGTQPAAAIGAELLAGRSLGVRIGWAGGGGHFVIINGLEGDMVVVSDPAFGVSTMTLGAFTASYQGNGSWTHSYFTED